MVNDFSIQVATVNGSGSQTANSVLMRAIFQMGIPVSGKNMFPSNIAGLPTWFTIRASKNGYIGRRKEVDFLVAMNPETAREDVMKLDSGAEVVYDEPLKLNELRSDLHFYPVPFDKLVAPVCPDAKLRKLVRNMIYDGVVAWILSIEMEEVQKALVKQFGKRKAKAAELNWNAARAGYDFASKTFAKSARRVERMNATAGKITSRQPLARQLKAGAGAGAVLKEQVYQRLATQQVARRLARPVQQRIALRRSSNCRCPAAACPQSRAGERHGPGNAVPCDSVGAAACYN